MEGLKVFWACFSNGRSTGLPVKAKGQAARARACVHVRGYCADEDDGDAGGGGGDDGDDGAGEGGGDAAGELVHLRA